MAISGARKRPSSLRHPRPPGVDPPEMPRRFREPQHADLCTIWHEHIVPAYWLAYVDTPKAIMLVYLMREYLRDPDAMPAPRMHQLRLCATDLCLDPVARARVGGLFDDYA